MGTKCHAPLPDSDSLQSCRRVLPMPAAELARYLPGSNPVRRLEPHMMQLLCDVMVSASGGAMLVAHRNNIPLPGIAHENGVFAQSMYAGMEDDEVFHAAQGLQDHRARTCSSSKILPAASLQRWSFVAAGRETWGQRGSFTASLRLH